MELTKEKIAGMIDISAVQAESNIDEVRTIVEAARQHHFICVFTLPSFTAYVSDLLKDCPEIRVGGTVGFPSGASTSKMKILEAKELLGYGCKELDMVINVGKLKSGLYDHVADDIQQVIMTAGTTPVKVILEVGLLTDEEIQTGAKITRDSGASFVKTGTGWNGSTTFEHIRTIKAAVGDSIPLKVAGGVRDLDTLLAFINMGVTRFGIGYRSALSIIAAFEERYR
jgi:deoxyribose-phosphate aldolase